LKGRDRLITSKHYVPVLKGKEGEFKALGELPLETKRKLVPIIEIPFIPWDYTNEAPSKSLDEHLARFPGKIAQAWQGSMAPIYIDSSMLVGDDLDSSGRHPLVYLSQELHSQGVNCIPVISNEYGDLYLEAVRQIHQAEGSGCCIRLTSSEMEEPEEAIASLLEATHMNAGEVDLVIDLGAILEEQAQSMYLVLRGLLQALPQIAAWRSLVVVGSSFPLDLTKIKADEAALITRAEWGAWRRLLANQDRIPRLPAFGDYGVSHPDITEIDPRIIQMSANLRYTTTESWLVLKGRSVRRAGYEQTRALCQRLVARDEYCGDDFSWGDQWVSERAQGATGPGNATTWRKVGTNHHLVYVVTQISNQVASSG